MAKLSNELQKYVDANQDSDHHAQLGEIAVAVHLVNDLPLEEGRE